MKIIIALICLTLLAAPVLAATEREEKAKSCQVDASKKGLKGDKRKAFVNDIRQALYAAKICSYAQGFQMMRAAAKQYGWRLNYGGIALMWLGQCRGKAESRGDAGSHFRRKAGGRCAYFSRSINYGQEAA